MAHFKFGSRGMAAAVVALLATVAMSSCSDGGRDYSNSEVISIEKKSLKSVESWELSELYKSVEIIPLETSSETLFAGVAQAIVHGDNIYVLANMSANGSDAKVMQFKKDGSFVRQIGHIGEGPGEYNSVEHIVLSNDTLYAFDAMKRCFHAYNASTGEYLVSSPKGEYHAITGLNTAIKNPISGNFLFTSDVIFGDEDKRYALADGNPMSGAFNILIPPSFRVEGWIAYGYGRTHCTLCDLDGRNALAILPLDNMVYRIDYATNEVTPFCEIFPEKKMLEFEPMEDYGVAFRASLDAGIHWISEIFASKDYLIVDRMDEIIWNLGTSEGYRAFGVWKEDATDFPLLPLKLVGADSKTNTFICAYDAADFLDYYSTMPENPTYEVKEHNVGSVDEDSNSVLVLYTLK